MIYSITEFELLYILRKFKAYELKFFPEHHSDKIINIQFALQFATQLYSSLNQETPA